MSYAIDVIVPVYNRAHCIENLITELQKQTFRDFRVIFVDDGSTDKSCEVINRLLPEAGFPYLLVQKPNGGAGSARNAGLRAATAEWVSFVDSDDALQPEFLEYFHTAGTQGDADICICNLQMIAEGSGQMPTPLEPLSFEKLSGAEAMKIFCTNWIGPYCVFMNRNFQQENGLYFDENCTYCEDAPFITSVIAAAKKVSYIPQGTYIYYTYQGSLSRSPRLDKFQSAITSFRKVEDRLAKENSDVATVFNQMGGIRYYIATLRRGAVQMDYKNFIALAKIVDLPRYKKNVQYLQQRSQRLACRILLFSKTAFYYAVRLIFKD